MVMAQKIHDLFRFCAVGESREAAQIEKNNGDLAPVGSEQIVILIKDSFGDLRRQIALESGQTLQLFNLLIDLVSERAVPFLEPVMSRSVIL